MQLSIISNFHNIIHHVAGTTIGETIEASNLKIYDFDDVSVLWFRAHFYLIEKQF